jgi:DNA-binding response OmpR family regulator
MKKPISILLVEDHDDLREATVSELADAGYRVSGVDSGDAMDECLASFTPDIVLLDLNLPGEDGLSIARRLRAAHPRLGIIMVTARGSTKDVARGYGTGADIYLAKPVEPEALEAAIQALWRRLAPPVPAASGLVLDLLALRLQGPAGSVGVSLAEATQLAALARAREQRLETWQLLELTGKEAGEQEMKALAVQIVRLRKKLEAAGADGDALKAIRGLGYQLCLPLTLVKER